MRSQTQFKFSQHSCIVAECYLLSCVHIIHCISIIYSTIAICVCGVFYRRM